MLPSTGKFKEINCPFFDSGLCERPYCHFRHVKRESSEVPQASVSAVNAGNSSLALGDSGEFLQQIVSEAVRKVLEQTDLPSALARPSSSDSVESVSRNFATKVAEVLAPPIAASTSSQPPYNVPSSQPKVPSYKPTPISVLKNRHIPIPYSPSLTKSSTVLRKRSNSDESSIVQKKLKLEPEDPSKTFVSQATNSPSTKTYDPSNTSSVDHDALNSRSDSTQYSPAPIKGWRDKGFIYTPSAIDTLKPNTYVPSSSNAAQSSIAEYDPSEKSESSVEPTYEPLATNGSEVGSASYEPSQVSSSEPEYQPLICNNSAKEYVPTDIIQLESISEELDISPEIDLLHDLLHDELNASDSEDSDKKNNEVIRKCVLDSDIGNEIQSKDLVCDEKTLFLVEKPKSDCEGLKSDHSRKKLESDKKKNDDKKRSESIRKECNKKESEHERKKESNKRKSDSKKQSDASNSSSSSIKKRIDSERKKEDDRKKSESRRKGDHNENERRRSEDKKTVSEKKHSDHSHKKNDAEKKKLEAEKKKSESEVKKSENDKKKLVSAKDGSNDKGVSSTQNSKQTEKILSVDSEQKNKDKSSRVRSEHSHSSSRSEKKNSESKKHDHSHKKSVSGVNSNHNKKFLEKLSKIEEYSKSKTGNSKRRRSVSVEQTDGKKMKAPHKRSKTESSKKHSGDMFPDEQNYGNSVSDSEGSDVVDILDNVTLPSDTWASSDEETVTKECYRIFQEYEPNNVEKKPKQSYQPPSQQEEETPVPAKRRVAHEGAQNSKLLRPPAKRPSAPNPSLVLAERVQKIKESHAVAHAQAVAQAQAHAQALAQAQAHVQALTQAQALVDAQVQAYASQAPPTLPGALGSPPSLSQRLNDARFPATPSVQSPPSTGARKRIAHVPNVSILLDAKLKIKQKLQEQQQSAESGKESSTKAQTVPKGSQRVAHMPSEQLLSRPVVKGAGGKIPNNVRQNYLNILVDEYIKITSNQQEAFEKAEEEEKSIYSRSTTRAVYASHVSNTINRLRKAAQTNSASTSGKNDGRIVNRTVSHTSMLAGKVGTKGSWSIEKPRKPPASLANKTLYESLSQFIMSEEQLKQNGFPMSHSEEKGVAVIHNFYKKPFVPKTPLQRMCARCSKIYYVNQQGNAVKEEPCVYHWGRLFQSKTRGGWEARYNCCQGHGDAIGCSVGNSHVTDNFDPNNLRGFVKTLPKEEPPADGNYGVYALDCEMCYTTVGLELTRVTVIGVDLNVVYESLVKPESTILDYNTRFSGIREEDLLNITTNIYEVQSILLSFINDKTILIGHSLESDFKALKLIHPTVVDTSVVYPHKMGPPKKRALKTLCRDLLQKIIQESEGGHDSAEDARAAMEIMLHKVKEDLKTAW